MRGPTIVRRFTATTTSVFPIFWGFPPSLAYTLNYKTDMSNFRNANAGDICVNWRVSGYRGITRKQEGIRELYVTLSNSHSRHSIMHTLPSLST